MAGKSFKDLIKQAQKEWDCDSLMDGHKAARGNKIPFSSPLVNWATYGGIPRGKITEMFGAPGGGKAQPLYSKILTPKGFISMGDLQLGDEIFDGSGNRCSVVGIYPQGKKPIYEITTQGNNKIRVSDEHLNCVYWYDKDKKKRFDKVITTKELIELLQISRFKIRIDIPSVDWEEKPVPIDPYLLGFLIAEGCFSNTFGFSNSEDDVIKKVLSKLNDIGYAATPHKNCSFWTLKQIKRTRPSPLRIEIEKLGLFCKSVDKHIPDIYLYNSRRIRTELLQGMFDGDGTIKIKNKGCGVAYSTSSIRLSEDFAFLVRSLGIRDNITINQNTFYNNAEGCRVRCLPNYMHLLKSPDDVQVFSSQKHKSRFHPHQNPPMRNIVSIKYVGDEECQCIYVDSPLHTYISDDFIPTHNTTSAVDICKNAYNLFSKEHQQRIDELREKISKGHKPSVSELEELQEQGPKRVLYVDIEHAFDPEWSETLGIKEDEISIMQPPDIAAEKLLQMVEDLISTGEVGLVVLDSIPSLVTQAELDKKYGERTVSALAGLLNVFFRKIVAVLTRYDCTLLYINQIRDNMNNPYVVHTPGGQSPKFYSSLRIQFQVGTPVDFLGNELKQSAEDPAGYKIVAKIAKQKTAPWDRKLATYYLMCNKGIRPDFDYVELGESKYGFLVRKGAWYTIIDPYTGELVEDGDGKLVKLNGKAKVYEWLEQNQVYYERLKKYITDDISGGDATALGEPDSYINNEADDEDEIPTEVVEEPSDVVEEVVVSEPIQEEPIPTEEQPQVEVHSQVENDIVESESLSKEAVDCGKVETDGTITF